MGKTKKKTAKKTVNKIAKKAAIKRAIAKPAKKVAKPVKAAKPRAATNNGAPIPAKLPPIRSRDEYIGEATTLRMHVLSFNRGLGPVPDESTPEWVRIGMQRLSSAIDAFDGIDGIEDAPGRQTYGEALTFKKTSAASFAGSLARQSSNLLNRAVKADDRKTNEGWYEEADQAIDHVCMHLERFGEPMGAEDDPDAQPAGEIVVAENGSIAVAEPGEPDAVPGDVPLAEAPADEKEQEAPEEEDGDDEEDAEAEETADAAAE